MKQKLFYRNVRAGEQLDIFFVAAISSLLMTRFFLYLTGYPQLGAGGLHIGHMLWGGLLMLASMTITFSFLGLRVQRLAALIGGVGFGLFIDEIGKFITSDNDYFFRPSIGIIYAIFVMLYLTFNFLGRKQRLTSREYQLNAMAHLEEAVLHDMDPLEKQRAHELLAKASRRSTITQQLEKLIDEVDIVSEAKPGPLRRLLAFLDQKYLEFWRQRSTNNIVQLFFLIEAGLFVVSIFTITYTNLDDIQHIFSGTLTYGTGLIIGQFLSALVAAGYVLVGSFKLAKSRLEAFEDFRKATLINLFLTEFFIFSRIEFGALPGFLFNLGLLLLITYVMHQEQRNRR